MSNELISDPPYCQRVQSNGHQLRHILPDNLQPLRGGLQPISKSKLNDDGFSLRVDCGQCHIHKTLTEHITRRGRSKLYDITPRERVYDALHRLLARHCILSRSIQQS